MRNHLFTASLGCLLACSGTTEPETGPANDRGVLVASYADVADLTWSTDGSEVFFIEGYYRIRAVPATGGAPRTLFTSNISFGDIRAAANKLYVSTWTGSTPTTYRILRIDPSGPSNLNGETVLTYAGQVRSHHFVLSADARFVAFGDSLFDLVTATQRPLPMGKPWSFSPDGSQLLYQLEGTGSTGQIVLIATADLSSQALVTPNNIARSDLLSIGAHYWNGNDPMVLRVGADAAYEQLTVSVFDPRSAVDREIATVATDFASPATAAAITADGKRAVLWTGPFLGWTELHMIDTESLARSVVATVNGPSSTFVDNVILSPDGSRAVYIAHEGVGFGVPGTTGMYVVSILGSGP